MVALLSKMSPVRKSATELNRAIEKLDEKRVRNSSGCLVIM